MRGTGIRYSIMLRSNGWVFCCAGRIGAWPGLTAVPGIVELGVIEEMPYMP
jgi:hypothetical protein